MSVDRIESKSDLYMLINQQLHNSCVIVLEEQLTDLLIYSISDKTCLYLSISYDLLFVRTKFLWENNFRFMI